MTSYKRLFLTIVTSLAIGVPLSYVGVSALFWNNQFGETVSIIFAPGMTWLPKMISCNGGFTCFVQYQLLYYGLLGLIFFASVQFLKKLHSVGTVKSRSAPPPPPPPGKKRPRWREVFTVMTIVVFVLAVLTAVAGMRKTMDDHYFKGNDRMLETAISADDGSAIAQALVQGANVNARGKHGITPLMYAVDTLRASAVTELLARGANPNLKADDGNGAVSLAVENYRNSPQILFAIMKAGGDPNTRESDNDPVIMRFINDCNCEYIRHMKSFGADLDIHTRADDPIIIDAALGADWDVVWCLIELGAKYDYEGMSRAPLSVSIADEVPSSDSPIYPYKVKVWRFLHDQGIKLQPLK